MELITLSGTRHSVLQIRSYPKVDLESYPSIFIQAQVSANDMATLAGNTIPARLFLQVEENGPIWYSDEGQDVSLRIVSYTDGEVSAKVESGILRNTDTGKQAEMVGEFLAVSDR